ncbi:MAG: DNA polymerase III subunit delta' [Gammaproteobacteria bacterium]
MIKTLPERYPWHGPQWAQCLQRAHKATLPHALMLSGAAGLGKLDFAHRLACFLLCDTPSAADACGHCTGCRLVCAGNHPDFLQIGPEGESQQIKIDQVRALSHFVCLSRASAHYKVVLIANADKINRHAANSLLKTLEEPPPFSVILLVSARAASLPATLLSRCQRIEFKCPPHGVASEWLSRELPRDEVDTCLALARGAPLTALEWGRGDLLAARRIVFSDLQRLASARESAVQVAQRWRQYAPDLILSWLLSWLADIVKLQWKCAFDGLNNPDVDRGLQAIAQRLDLVTAFSLYDTLLSYRRLPVASINPQLMLEDMLIAWTNAFTSKTTQ